MERDAGAVGHETTLESQSGTSLHVFETSNSLACPRDASWFRYTALSLEYGRTGRAALS